jgi:hypothetical protein
MQLPKVTGIKSLRMDFSSHKVWKKFVLNIVRSLFFFLLNFLILGFKVWAR